MEFTVRTTSTGKYLFEQVISTIGMREMWFFGLQFEDDEGHLTWLNLNKTIVSQHIKEQTVSKGSKHRIVLINFSQLGPRTSVEPSCNGNVDTIKTFEILIIKSTRV